MTPDELLRRAIALSAAAIESGNPPFGSLLADAEGNVLAEDHNTSVTGNDITAHPELKLALWASRNLSAEDAARTTMYTSCQPCPMCTGAIARSGLGRVVFALASEQLQSLGAASPDAAEVTYDGPALFDEARVPIDGYYAT